MAVVELREVIVSVHKIHTFISTGTEYQMSNVGVMKYGPDVRLYFEGRKVRGMR